MPTRGLSAHGGGKSTGVGRAARMAPARVAEHEETSGSEHLADRRVPSVQRKRRASRGASRSGVRPEGRRQAVCSSRKTCRVADLSGFRVDRRVAATSYESHQVGGERWSRVIGNGSRRSLGQGATARLKGPGPGRGYVAFLLFRDEDVLIGSCLRCATSVSPVRGMAPIGNVPLLAKRDIRRPFSAGPSPIPTKPWANPKQPAAAAGQPE